MSIERRKDFYYGVGLRLDEIVRLANEGLQTDGAHHKQWYLEEILKQAADVDNLLIVWPKGVKP